MTTLILILILLSLIGINFFDLVSLLFLICFMGAVLFIGFIVFSQMRWQEIISIILVFLIGGFFINMIEKFQNKKRV